MPTIAIDSVEYEVPEGRTILQVLDDLGLLGNGVEVPHYCWHPKLSVDGSCRLCQVEIEGVPKLQIACNTPVANGRKVHTKSERVIAARRGVMEFLLINHPLDCPICDQGGECQLQDLAVGYGGSASRYHEEKRVVFRSWWLPYVLVAPQLAITIVFFFWPAGQAVWQSLLAQDPFGINVEFVGLENFRHLFSDENYLASFRVTAVFSVLVAGIGLSFSLLLAVFADRAIRGAGAYKTLLVWPYAVAPVVAAILWLFLFNPTLGVVAHWIRAWGVHWDPLLDSGDALTLIVIAAAWKQVSYNFLFFLAGLQSIPKSLIEAAAIDGAGPGRRFWTIVFPLLSPTTFFLPRSR